MSGLSYLSISGGHWVAQAKQQTDGSWTAQSAETLDEFVRLVRRAEAEGPAWRGHARPEWELETTLDRALNGAAPNESYERWLAREHNMLEHFKEAAERYASDSERSYFRDPWSMRAFGRHSGLATRLLDWTESPWVAAWFACHEHRDADGVVWWFNQEQLEEALQGRWDEWCVPQRADYYGFDCLTPEQRERLELHERALEATAFSAEGAAWVTKLHYRFPCPRMEAQQGFATVCGRLHKTHDEAMDDLDPSCSIRRGRIVIASGLKKEVLAKLQRMNIHATSLKYPGVDIVARSIRL